MWNRRERRKNPDSDRRERLYRLRDESEWIRIGVPDLQIVDDSLWESVRRQIAGRRRSPSDTNPARSLRRKHLLSELIKCAGSAPLTQQQLNLVEAELANLEQNLLKGVLSPTLQRLLTEREAEKARLEAQLVLKVQPAPSADILPHPVLLQRFEAKVRNLRTALNEEAIRAEAAQVIAELIESVTIHPGSPNGPEAEVTARVEVLMDYAANENSPLAELPEGCSVSVVAGVGFEPTTFRL